MELLNRIAESPVGGIGASGEWRAALPCLQHLQGDFSGAAQASGDDWLEESVMLMKGAAASMARELEGNEQRYEHHDSSEL